MFPFEIKTIEREDDKVIKKYFKGKVNDFVSVGPKKWILPEGFKKHADKYYNFDIKNNDVWIVTYMKSGTTLMQELLWMVVNDSDYETSSKLPLFDRCPFFEGEIRCGHLNRVKMFNGRVQRLKKCCKRKSCDRSCQIVFSRKLLQTRVIMPNKFNIMWTDEFKANVAEMNDNDPKVLEELKDVDIPCYETAKNMKSPRLFKTHLPPSLLPPALNDICKVIYVARNPFDVAVSYYHHSKLIKSHEYQGDFKKFWEFFEKNLVLYSPYWEHIKEGWAKRHHPNFLFLFYEDIIRDFPAAIRKVAEFLNKKMTDDEVNRLAEHLHIDNFRKNVRITKIWKTEGIFNPKAQGFIRRGKIGGNEEFEDEIKLKADKWFKENLANTDIEFPQF